MRFLSAVLVGLLAPNTVAGLVCHSGATCADTATCTSSSEGAGRQFGCSPLPSAAVCSDARFSCPKYFSCDLLSNHCHRSDTNENVSLLVNIAASQGLMMNAAPANTSNVTNDTTNASSFCDIVADEIPSSCNCTDFVLGGSINCKVALVHSDAFGVRVDVKPCDAEASHVDIAVTEASHNISFKVAGIQAGEEKDMPVPGLAIIIPKIGSVGVDISAKVSGDLDDLHVEVGVNACGMVLGYKLCGSMLTSYLPYWIMRGSYKFGNLCKSGPPKTATVVV